MTITIYILECEQGKYYVGRSAYASQRILSHFNKRGSEWTKLYKPKRIISTFVGDAFDEEKYTLKTMEAYGIDNVRGGSYCAIVLSPADKAKARQTIQSLTDKCYKCGSSGHFAVDCKKEQKECSMCEGTKRLYLGNGDWGDCIMCDSDSDSDDECSVKRCIHSMIWDNCDMCNGTTCQSCSGTGRWEDGEDELDCPMCH